MQKQIVLFSFCICLKPNQKIEKKIFFFNFFNEYLKYNNRKKNSIKITVIYV